MLKSSMSGLGLGFFVSASLEAEMADFGRGCSSKAVAEGVPEDASFMALKVLLASWLFPDATFAVAMLGC